MRFVAFVILALSTFTITSLSAVADEEFVYPLAVVSQSADVVFVADRSLPGIWKVEKGKKSIYFRGSKKFRTPLNAVRCLAIDHEGNLLAGDSSTREVYRFDADAKPQPLTGGKIGIPMALVVTKDGLIYVADLEQHRIVSIASGGGEPQEVVAVNSPRGLTIAKDGTLFVLSTSSPNGQVQRLGADGKLVPVVKGRPFGLPHNIVAGEDTTLYVSDNYGHCIWQVRDGKPEKLIEGEPLDRPVGLCRQGKSLLVADPHIRTIFQLDLATKKVTTFAKSE